jgi:hypothetical protein
LFHGIDGKRLTLESREGVPLFSIVSVECNDVLFLGEVLTSVWTTNGSWRSEVKVEQVLTGLQSLINLRSHLLSEGVGTAPDRSMSLVYA